MKRAMAVLSALLAAILSCGGCDSAGAWKLGAWPAPAGTAQPSASADSPEAPRTRFGRYELRDRAENLLLAGTRSDIDLIVCNSIEALEKSSPATARTRVLSLLESDSPLVRFAALVSIGKLRERSGAAQARRLMTDPNPRVRLAASFAAARLGEATGAEKLLQVLQQNPDENLRSDAAYLIGKLGEPRALKRLESAQALKLNERSNRVLMHILDARAELGDKSAIVELAAYTQGDSVSRVLALQMLAELGKPEGRGALAYTLRNQNEYIENRLIAARGLGRLGARDGAALARQSLAHEGKNVQDVHETARVRALAALALGDMRDGSSLEPLRQLCTSSTDERVQVAAAYAICQIVGD